MSDKLLIADTPHAISYVQLAALKGAVHLESVGMRHSSGLSMKKRAMEVLGLKGRKTSEQVIEALKTRMEEMIAEKRSEPTTK